METLLVYSRGAIDQFESPGQLEKENQIREFVFSVLIAETMRGEIEFLFFWSFFFQKKKEREKVKRGLFSQCS